MPRHQEVKRTQFLLCFHNAQLTIPFNDWTQATGYSEHKFSAGKALQGYTEVVHTDT